MKEFVVAGGCLVDEDLSFGYWLRRRRKALDLTQAELGRRVGASAAMIRKIEADERRPSRELALILADQLAVPRAEREAFLRAARDVAAADALSRDTEPVTESIAIQPVPNLPISMTSIVDREHDMAAVTALLSREDVRLLTIVGPPGIGKTHLSVQIANRLQADFSDGAWIVDLSTVDDPELVLPTVVLALGLTSNPGLPTAQQVQMHLRDKHMLLVLDNLEQIVSTAAVVIANLLRTSPQVTILATSRVRLDVYGEHEYPLLPMSLPPVGKHLSPEELLNYEAVELFIARIRQYRPDFGLTADTSDFVVAICHHIDGIPLALELAAARARRMPLSELADALSEKSGGDWNDLLQTTARDLPPRQRTLSNAVAWSYSLLEPDLQAVLGQLSVFAEPFDWPAVVGVVKSPGLTSEADLREALNRLVENSLVRQLSRSPERWRLLRMIREFACRQVSDGDYWPVRRRHALHYMARLVSQHESDPYNVELDNSYLKQVDEGLANYRAALEYALDAGDSILAHELGSPLWKYWESRGLLSTGRRFLEAIIALDGEVDDGLRMDVVYSAASAAWMQHDLVDARRYANLYLAVARKHERSREICLALNLLGRIFLEEGRYAEADEILAEANQIGRAPLYPDGLGWSLILRGEAALALDDLARAEILTHEGLEHITADSFIFYCVAWINLAEVALLRNQVSEARDALQLALLVAPKHMRRLRTVLVSVAGYVLASHLVEMDDARSVTQMLSYVVGGNETLGDLLSSLTRKQLAERLQATHSLLAAESWQTAWDEGRHWTAEDALAAATDVLSD